MGRCVAPIEASDPFVETQFMTGPHGAIAVVINWRQEVIEDLVIRFPALKQVKSVRSLRQAGFFDGQLDDQKTAMLEIQTTSGIPQIYLRLELTDYLLIDSR